MTIEFACGHCGKALSTTDDKAGRKAKCPGCGEAITVPGEAAVGNTAAGDEGFPPPHPGEGVACPMCGEQNAASARVCEYCGESLGRNGQVGIQRGNQSIDVGDVISSGWAIFKQEMGLTIGACLVAGLLSLATQIPSNVLGFLSGIMQAQGEDEAALAMTLGVWVLMPLVYAAQWFLQLGLSLVLLRIARGEETGIGDIFSGGKYFWRMVGASILFLLMIFVGLIACIIPGIILSLMFWPYAYVLIDENPKGIDCLSKAREYTSGNLGTVFILGLACFGINVLGLLALGVGMVFTYPLTMLIMAVAYCKMSGQRVAA